ncbi:MULTISPECIES: TrkH family potassium uptake protein [unclassified Leptolyngbya]|uniref:TrkH family potassium uptake protein n=1 Tax=unclassified Leptolyngbya TaxID=2650499 RepID=UPI00168884DC|nr:MULTISPECIES: TrkH family potassium uptake protein [unclassified Leptolyngbya]MBD1910546.1 ATPase [Leptolyngbya sp. FACHB-8]MBD2153917.1 ATPase [Leptolyngbya sp. FACHB-16]
MTIPRTICLGFAAFIAVGTLLLMLPISITSGQWGDFIVSLFMSTSAVCVTGLAVVDPGTYFTPFGQAMLLLLVQMGGLGYMTANTLLLLVLRRRLRLRDKLAIQQALDKEGLSGARNLVKSIIGLTLLFELTGTFLMIPTFVHDHGWSSGLWYALFHSVSAFNNAGFALFSDNLIGYATSIPINLVITFLIIFGGIGYQVIMEMFIWIRDRIQGRPERVVLPLNFKVVISTTLALLIVGTLAFFIVEYRNPEVVEGYNTGERLLLAWFQSVVPRTAGFNTINYGDMTQSGLFITIALMFIGASPGGTGGGIKTTTVRVLYSCTKSVLQGKQEVLCYRRQIPMSLILKAVAVLFGSATTVVLSSILISITDPELEFIKVLFESVSAFATVGLSTGITATVTVWSKLVLIGTMYVGRVGILLLMSAVLGDPSPSAIRYPEENLLVG